MSCNRSIPLRVGFLLSVLSVGCGAQAAETSLASVQQIYDGKVKPDQLAETFRHMDRLFPSRTVKHGTNVKPLEKYDRQLTDVSFMSKSKKYDLFDYLSANRVSGLLVLKNGKIALEDYELGSGPTSKWISMSVAKSITSTLIGAAIKDGYISSIDDRVDKYLPELKGGGYDGVTIKQLLQMSSGVRWNETYTDPKSDRRQMLELQSAQKGGAIIKMMASLPRAGEPGTIWKYSTGETHVAGALLRAAVKKPLADYLSEKIWSRFGMEADATWWLEFPDGLEVGGSGFNATLRDYGRFGLFFMANGVIGDTHVLPDGWRDAAGSPKQIGGQMVDYGYMWWPLPASGPELNRGSFQATGIFGEHIYINPAENVVIVVWSARSKPTGSDAISDADFYAGVVQTLK